MTESIIISWSEIDAYRQCPHKHLLNYKERWTAPTNSAALTRGSAWHQVLEAHYGSLMEQPNNIVAAKDAAYTILEGIRYSAVSGDDTPDLIEWMYQGHLDHYGIDDHWKIVGVEQKINVPLLTAAGRKSRFILKMQIDLIVEDRTIKNKLFLIDHKTGSALPTEKKLELADQFSTYMWGMRQLGHPIFGAIWNGAITRKNKGEQPLDKRFLRTTTVRTDRELTTIAQELHATARAMYSPDNVGERHPDPDTCRWKCPYTEACIFGRKTSYRQEREFLQASGFYQEFTRH